MKYYYKCWLWGNGSKGKELTQYMMVPFFYEDNLDESLSTAEIILDKVPISMLESISPKTKIRVERYLNKDFSDIPKKYDLIVEHDDVEQYRGLPEYCCHRISCIEPSAVAQGMHVDNIALTYELQDVTLNYRTIQEPDENLFVSHDTVGYSEPLKQYYAETTGDGVTSRFDTIYFINSYRYFWDELSLTSLKNLFLEINAADENVIEFTIPTLFCQGTYDNQSWQNLFEVNTITKIYRYQTNNGVVLQETKTLIIEKESGPTTLPLEENDLFVGDGESVKLRKLIELPNERQDGWKNKDELLSVFPVISQINSNYTKYLSFTTTALSDADIENGLGYYYSIEVIAKPIESNSMVSYYKASWVNYSYMTVVSGIGHYGNEYQTDIVNPNDVSVKTSFYCSNLYSETAGGPFLMKGVKYSCYDLLRKALLTIDTQIINNEEKSIDDIEYLIYLDPQWLNRLKTAKVQETIFEGKNLWEILLQIGYYLHAIPTLKFAEDGTDRFMLSFAQLGGTTINNDSSNKITIFNSKNINDYFTQYDSYVTNLFSPQNLVDEWLVCKTEDDSCLVSNNTALLKTSYGISEVLAFDITYDGSNGGEAGTKSALEHIFEHSIYEILTSDYRISPGKGDSLYYSLGDTSILGLNYIPPSVNEGDMPMSLKRIVGKLFTNVNINNVKFNSLKFHIKYRTQDSVRLTQIRPDLESFMKNSQLEQYPHHEQFYGQQDKIIDSERFSANLFGRLIRVGNEIYQRQEYVGGESKEKETGELVLINGQPYYVVRIENECYPDAIFQKVTYSKNFNQLSNIVTIPSEPRFYEVSERSKIRREVRLMDYFAIKNFSEIEQEDNPTFINNDKWKDFISKLIFNKEKAVLPNFAYTKFLCDKKRSHLGSVGQYIPVDKMFPSSEIDRSDPNQVAPEQSKSYSECVVPVLHFPLHDGIVFEWDMADNFKAGDSIDTSISGYLGTADRAYYALQSVRYCDIMGRAELFSFKLFNKEDWTIEQSQALPKATYIPSQQEAIILLPEPYSICLEKDGREELSFDYQLNLLHKHDINGDDFITFPNIFGQKESELYCCALDKQVSLFEENVSLIPANILSDKIGYNLNFDEENNLILIEFPDLSIDKSQIKSLVFYQEDDEGNKTAFLAKNVVNAPAEEKLQSLAIVPVFGHKALI